MLADPLGAHYREVRAAPRKVFAVVIEMAAELVEQRPKITKQATTKRTTQQP